VTDEQLLKIKEKALRIAQRMGFRDQSEDLAHDVVARYLEDTVGVSRVGQVLVDCIRAKYGRSSTPGHKERRAIENAVNIDLVPSDSTSFEYQPKDHTLKMDVEIILSWCRSKRARKMLRQYYLEDMDIKEIAESWGSNFNAVNVNVWRFTKELQEEIRRRGLI